MQNIFLFFLYFVSADEILTNLTSSADEGWSDWSECSKQCGGGVTSRSAILCEKECDIEENHCNEQECAWSDWTPGTCSKECGPGLATRTRECPEENSCIGSERETVKCNEKPCAAESIWANWNEWSSCTRTCGPFGKQERKRQCNGHGCAGQSIQVWGCNRKVKCEMKWVQKSQPQESWESWKAWSRCAGSCPNGTQTRYRRCKLGWLKCTGPHRENQVCEMHNCNNQVSNPKPAIAPKPSMPGLAIKVELTTKSPSPIQKVPGNLIGNGHCEEEPGTWGAIENFYCNNCHAARWTEDAHDGTSSIKVSARIATWAGINYSFGTSIADGGSYKFVGWIKILKWGSHKIGLTAKVEGGLKPQYLNQLSKTISGFSWVKLEANVEVSGGAVTLYLEGSEKADYLIDQFSLVRVGGPAAPPKNGQPPAKTGPATDTTDEKLRDPGFEISPNWGAGWGCQGCTGVAVTNDVKQGKKAMLVTKREDTWAGPVQKMKYGTQIKKNVVYTASIWVKSLGTDKNMDTYELTVKIDYRTKKDVWLKFGKLCTIPGEWGLLSGEVQLTMEPSQVNVLEFYIEGPQKNRNFLVDGASFKVGSVSKEWFEETGKKIDDVRKANLSIRTFYDRNVTISIEQTTHAFPFGSAVDSSLFVSNQKYREFFLNNFNIAVLENKLKWKQIEYSEGNRNFAEADRAIGLLEKNKIPVRGHTVVWAVDKFVPKWLTYKSPAQQRTVVKKHVDNMVGRYKNRLIHWDVNNEMLHGDYFQKNIGGTIRSDIFKWTREADPKAELFVNDYEIISGGLTNCYKEQIKELMAEGAPIDGIGVQCHFKDAERNVNPVQVTNKFDSLAELGLPIWVTEFDVSQNSPVERAKHMSYFMHAAFSHPSIEGLLFWGYWDQRHWRGSQASLVDGHNFALNAAGKKYRELVFGKWWTQESHDTSEGVTTTRIFKGDHVVTIKDGDTVLETKTISISEDKDLCFGSDEQCTPQVQLKMASQPDNEPEGSGSSGVDLN